MMFLTPHIIDGPEDVVEIQRVKDAQRQEFLRRFYGTSRDEYYKELQSLLRYSMNFVDEPSVYRGPTNIGQLHLDEAQLSQATADALKTELENEQQLKAGDLPPSDQNIIVEPEPEPAPAPAEPAPQGDGG
jgi:hypothetical protein